MSRASFSSRKALDHCVPLTIPRRHDVSKKEGVEKDALKVGACACSREGAGVARAQLHSSGVGEDGSGVPQCPGWPGWVGGEHMDRTEGMHACEWEHGWCGWEGCLVDWPGVAMPSRATLVLGGASVARLRASCEETNQPEGAPGAGGLRSLRLGNRRRTARQKDGGE